MQSLSKIFEQILQLDYTPVVLAILLGGAIGLEREIHGRPAGMRTMILVCLCSTILIYASIHYVPRLPADAGTPNLVFDPQRLAAGIVTGIGFLGAAAVVRSGDMVRGITTGACVWCVAGLGIVIGHGAYGLAVAATVTFLLVLVLFDKVTGGIRPIVYRRLIVRGAAARVESLIEEVRAVLGRHRIQIQDLEGDFGADGREFHIVFHVRCRNLLQAPRVLGELGGREGVASVRWSVPG